jgi:hypothetical protein
MKKYLLIITTLFSFNAFAQEKALTNRGETVLLFSDGTWKYEKESEKVESEIISINNEKFVKTASQDFIVKSNKTNVGVWIDPKKWKFKTESSNEDAEYTFELKNEELYGMMINEKTEIPIDLLLNVAFENAVSAAPDTKIIKKEYQFINGKKVAFMEMVGTIQGIKFHYFGLYFSQESGSVQLLTYCTDKMAESYRKQAHDFLKGFVVFE